MSSKALADGMSSDSSPALEPKLRFPEFRDTAKWKPRPLRLACQMQAGNFVPASEIRAGNEQGLYPCYGGNGLRGYTATFTHSGTFSLIGRQGALCGNVRQATGRFHATEHAIVVTPKSGVSGDYLFFVLDFLNLNRFASGQAQPGLSVDVLDKLPIVVPDHESEQQKVADCLFSVGDLIAAQARKVGALKSHKVGLMRRLLPGEGETQPDLRFPEFEGAGKWACEGLCNCLDKVIDYRGKAPPKSDSGVPLITAKNVRLGWLDMTNDEYIEEDKYEDWMTRGIPKAGDILFTTEAPLGNVALFPSAGRLALGQRILTLRSRADRCLPEFLFQSLLGPRMQNEIDFHSTGSTAKGIKSAVFVKISFCYPGIEEQQRIADCLTSLDDLIGAEAQRLEALKTHKKGLMQQLFQSTEEVEA